MVSFLLFRQFTRLHLSIGFVYIWRYSVFRSSWIAFWRANQMQNLNYDRTENELLQFIRCRDRQYQFIFTFPRIHQNWLCAEFSHSPATLHLNQPHCAERVWSPSLAVEDCTFWAGAIFDRITQTLRYPHRDHSNGSHGAQACQSVKRQRMFTIKIIIIPRYSTPAEWSKIGPELR